MKDSQITKLTTVTRKDLPFGVKVAQSCHSVAEFSYHNRDTFDEWIENSNYKICVETENEKKLIQLFFKLLEKGAKVTAFFEPDLGDQMTAFTFANNEELNKYTKYLPLVGKNMGVQLNWQSSRL